MDIIVKEVKCPVCGAEEEHPDYKGKPLGEGLVLIRAFKVFSQGRSWSQCLVCSGYYAPDLKTWDVANHDPEKGWFAS